MKNKRPSLQKISNDIYLKLTGIRDKVNQLHNGILWADLDVQEIDELREISKRLTNLIERRRGTF